MLLAPEAVPIASGLTELTTAFWATGIAAESPMPPMSSAGTIAA